MSVYISKGAPFTSMVLFTLSAAKYQRKIVNANTIAHCEWALRIFLNDCKIELLTCFAHASSIIKLLTAYGGGKSSKPGNNVFRKCLSANYEITCGNLWPKV